MMQYCSEKELNDAKFVQAYLGRPFKESGKVFTVTGSGGYFIEDLSLPNTLSTDIPEDAKATIQRYEKGLFVLFNKSTKQYGIMLAWSDIASLELEEGKNVYRTIPLLPMWWLIKLGVKQEVARIAGIFGEYRQEPLQLRINLGSHRICLYSNGFSFTEKRAYFNSMSKLITVTINPKE
jgi:hypothetical protein